MLRGHIAGELRRGVTEYCVLGVLTRGETYGYRLAKILGVDSGLLPSEAALYPILTRLRKLGWVTTSWSESPSGPPRKYYTITDVGRQSLGEFRLQWKQLEKVVDNLTGE